MPSGAWQAVTGVGSLPLSAPVVGNGRAVSLSVAMISLAVICGRADIMRATVPETRGAEKLVPTLGLKASVQIEPPAAGPRVPLLDVAMMGYRQGDPAAVLTQLPPGALMVISGPRSEKPTLLPTWRSPATAITPGQFAGVPVAWPVLLPAAATTTALRAASAFTTSM